MFPILQIGPVALQLPGLFLLAGIWLGSLLLEREAPRHNVSGAVLNSLVVYGLIAGVVGARLAYGLRYLAIYAEDPLGLFSLNPAALAPTEGLLIALTVLLVLGRRWHMPVWPSLDSLAPGLAVFAVFLGIAHLSSGDAFGAPTTVTWAIELWGAKRHPTQIYEVLLAAVSLAALWRLRQTKAFGGFLFFAWLGMAAASRLFVEGFRGDSTIVLGGLRAAQLTALGVLAVVLVGLYLRARVGLATGLTEPGPTGER